MHVRARLVHMDPTLLESLEVTDVQSELLKLRSRVAKYECKPIREGGQKSGRVLQYWGISGPPAPRGEGSITSAKKTMQLQQVVNDNPDLIADLIRADVANLTEDHHTLIENFCDSHWWVLSGRQVRAAENQMRGLGGRFSRRIAVLVIANLSRLVVAGAIVLGDSSLIAVARGNYTRDMFSPLTPAGTGTRVAPPVVFVALWGAGPRTI